MPDKCTEPCAEVVRLERELDKFQAQNSDTHKEIFRRLNGLEQAEAAQEQHFSTVNEKLDKLLKWQENQLEKPSRRWEGIVEKAVWAVCAAVIAFLLGRVGL
ncbi:MAG: hypothetical protein K2O93_01675 [Oscillospiraceae bacterium]|nr:hypothetical protein [Oscillospiraceae bacterium]